MSSSSSSSSRLAKVVPGSSPSNGPSVPSTSVPPVVKRSILPTHPPPSKHAVAAARAFLSVVRNRPLNRAFQSETRLFPAFSFWSLLTPIFGLINVVGTLITAFFDRILKRNLSIVNVFFPDFTLTSLKSDANQGFIAAFAQGSDPLDNSIEPHVTPKDVLLAYVSKSCYENNQVIRQIVSVDWQLDGRKVSVVNYRSGEAGERKWFGFELPAFLNGPTGEPAVEPADAGEPLPDTDKWDLFDTKAIILPVTDAGPLQATKAVIVAFRGTQPTQMAEYLTDTGIDMIRYPGTKRSETDPVCVHRGFANALGVVKVAHTPRENGEKATAFERLIAKLATLYDNYDEIYITGHSLGAALATIFAFSLLTPLMEHYLTINGRSLLLSQLKKIRPRIKGLSTIGTPFQGNVAYATEFDRLFAGIPVHRNINNQDIVGRVPLVAHPIKGQKVVSSLVSTVAERSLKVLAQSDFGGILGNLDENGLAYAGTKGLRYLVSQRLAGTTKIQLNVAADSASATQFINYDEYIPVWLQPYSLLDHNPDDYVRHLDQAAGGEASGPWIYRFLSDCGLDKFLSIPLVLFSKLLQFIDPRGYLLYTTVLFLGFIFEITSPFILSISFFVSSIVSINRAIRDEIHSLFSDDY